MENKFIFPTGFSSKRAPRRDELDALWNFLIKYDGKIDGVLEFGSGITSWVLNNTLHPKKHVCIESFPISVDNVKKYVPSVEVVGTWDQIPTYSYDLLFIDSSTGAPKDLQCLYPEWGLFRHDAIHYARKFLKKDAIVVMHDWNHKPKWQVSRKYLEENGYKLIWSYTSKYGFGAYQNV